MWQSSPFFKHYVILDDHNLRMEFENDYRKNMEFVKAMANLVVTYRNFDMEEHPSILAMQDDATGAKDEL